MLVEFRVKNFRSFRDEQVLSLVASKDDSLPENCCDVGKLRLLKAASVYGPNASGKSNLVKALAAMEDLVLRSASYEPGSDLQLKPFLLNEISPHEPSRLEITFFHKEVRYQYGFCATAKSIESEWLFAFPKGKPQAWFKRRRKKGDDGWEFGTYLKGDRSKLAEKTRGNALFLSVAAQWNHEQLTKVYEWFKEFLRVVTVDTNLYPVTASALESGNKEKGIYEAVLSLLRNADLGVTGVNVHSEKVDIESILSDFTPEARKRLEDNFKKLANVAALRVEFMHQQAAFPLSEESHGTQRLFDLAVPWWETMQRGYTVVIDELDRSLHPLLTRALIQLIQRSSSEAQLVFATHDTTLLDPDLLRRDQVWFTEKDGSGATSLYSLSDYKTTKARKGEPMQKGYLAGRYGAIPILEAFGER